MTAGKHSYTVFETSAGFVALAWSPVGVSGLRLPSTTEAAAEAAILRRLPEAKHDAPPPPIATLVEDIRRYFAGERVEFADVPVDLGEQAPFFAAVYARIRGLGWGQTTTYGGVAKDLGAPPQDAREVGQAMASNPVPLIVPCHRVLAAGQKIGGFSAPGGSRSKARMLQLEGVDIAEPTPPKRALGPPAQITFDF